MNASPDNEFCPDSLDVALAEALADVPLPEGLEARLCRELSVQVNLPTGHRNQGWARRGMYSAFAAALAALVLVTAWYFTSSRPADVSPLSIAQESIAYYTGQGAVEGRSIEQSPPPSSHPASVALRGWPGVRWRWVDDFPAGRALAYDVQTDRGSKATLYVLQKATRGLPMEPPERPIFGTGNCSAAIWSEGSLVYVLVVQGDANTYLNFLELPRGEVT